MEQTKEQFIEMIAKNWDVYYLPSGEINTDVLKAIEEAIDFVLPQPVVSGQVCGTCGSKDVTDWNTYFRCNECDSRC